MRRFVGVIALGIMSIIHAETFLVYVDSTSSITVPMKKGYLQDFSKLSFHAGDHVVVLPLGTNTYNPTPIASETLPGNNNAYSDSKNKEEFDASIIGLKSNLSSYLKKAKDKTTTITGAFTHANNYFKQNNTPKNGRTMILFTDGIEESGGQTGLNFTKLIPKNADSVDIPSGINSKVYMIGISTTQNNFSTLQGFWNSVCQKSNSNLKAFSARL